MRHVIVVFFLDRSELSLHRLRVSYPGTLDYSRCHRSFIKEGGRLRSLLLLIELEFLQLVGTELLRGCHWSLFKLTFLDLELSDPLGVVKFISCNVEVIEPVIIIDHLEYGILLTEQDDLTAVFRVLAIAWSLLDLTPEDGLLIKFDLN